MIELTVKQYADLRGISKQAVYDAIGRKAIPHKTVYIKPQTVIEVTEEDYAQLSGESDSHDNTVSGNE